MKTKTLSIRWSLPLEEWVKLNIDASILNLKASGGKLLSDHSGMTISVLIKNFEMFNLCMQKL